MPHFFISYAKKDTRELALALDDALNALPGITAWVDRSLRAGRSWELQIQAEIDRCDYMIVLYSPDLNRHKQGLDESYVLTEIAYARYTAKKTIIPVMAQATEPPMSLTTTHYIDFTLPGLVLDDLVAAVCDEAEITADVSAQPRPPDKPRIPSQVYDLLPPPFDWCAIPAGMVRLEGGGYVPTGRVPERNFDVPAFHIARYPITNAQFARFIEAGGYSEPRWWTETGWEVRETEGWTEPQFWNDTDWNGANHPVVGVSWPEAVAFCLWLSAVSGETILLPTEQQWQRAAQGDDGRLNPWGNTWDATRCNNNVDSKGLGKTTPVRQYEGKGDSPFGVTDMAGNVWEWCRTTFMTGSNDLDRSGSRVVRGGSWRGELPGSFRCDLRYWGPPTARPNEWGFRIARLSGSTAD